MSLGPRSKARTIFLTAALAVASPLAAVLVAQSSVPVPLVERARGAEQVVVGRVTAVNPVWQVNEFGDRLIVSVVRLAVDETLKGAAQSSVDVEVEGGTIGGLTLHVSDEESFVPGDRAVFYLRRSVRGALVPHLRGQGTLKLDRNSRVPNSSLTLNEITSTAATMYPSVSPCNMSNRTLDIDDINGVQTLYPPMNVPTAPTGVRILPGFLN